MIHREELLCAAAIAAAALGLDIASGRAMAAFYAQTVKASWLGVAFFALCFGLAVGFLARWARRIGAGSLYVLLRRLGCGRLASVLHGLILISAMCMAAGEAGHIGALVLPVQHAGVYGALIALLIAAAGAFSGRGAVQKAGAVYLAGLLVYMALLLCFAQMPKESLDYGLELKMENNVWAALLLSLLHAAVAVCVSAALTVKLGSACMRPAWLGLYAGLICAVVLGLGNALLQVGEPVVLRLKMPFAALSCSWGSPGFYAGAGMIYMGSIAAMAGMIYGCIPKRKCRIFIEN